MISTLSPRISPGAIADNPQIVGLDDAARGPEATNNFLSASTRNPRKSRLFSLKNLAESWAGLAGF
jgi:hypothetical protein